MAGLRPHIPSRLSFPGHGSHGDEGPDSPGTSPPAGPARPERPRQEQPFHRRPQADSKLRVSLRRTRDQRNSSGEEGRVGQLARPDPETHRAAPQSPDRGP
ncbi:balbiani ring protein 6-like [Phyllostomus hastatus]|uniref:balbiani ring protein 6-like n=1 Tax=Phyllostomus hastatus TaxID=9423 RepID=UPI001E6819D3|nr:balbiani ring protein 6-like [Phyllostomus hastatus]